MRIKIKLCIFILLIQLTASAQIGIFDFQRELKGITDTWHKIILPEDIYSRVNPSLSDVRIFGIGKNNDTTEVPFIIRSTSEKHIENKIKFKLINQSKTNEGYYFVFDVPVKSVINEIDLSFNSYNFDWNLVLEGSQDNRKWLTILDNYRILGIKNNTTEYKFTTVNFPESEYRYYRLFLKSKTDPGFEAAVLSNDSIVKGTYVDYSNLSVVKKVNTENKQNIIHVDLGRPKLISGFKINVKKTFDYYRPFSIEYLTDSFNSEKGWKYNWSTAHTGILSSLEKNDFTFNQSIVSNKVMITIDNYNNEPLEIDSVNIFGIVNELAARFSHEGSYYLIYGNKTSSLPNYDIEKFQDKIPSAISPLTLGPETKIEKTIIPPAQPLFQNKTWLWIVMSIIILILGWFSLRMLKS